MTNQEPISPRLPEHYRAESIGGMLPDQIIYPSAYAFDIDAATRVIYVEIDRKIEADDPAPSYVAANRTALMKVLYLDGENEVEGFIADLRLVKSGVISEKKLSIDEDTEDFEVKGIEDANRTHQPLLGAIMLDADGIEYYEGNERLQEHALHLVVTFDALIEEKDSTVKKSIEDRLKPKGSESENNQAIEMAVNE